MYQIKCDGYVLYDPRDDDLIVANPKCKLEVNTVGEASFSIYSTHPYYDKLHKMRSVFEILQDGRPIFRGRMTDDTRDFNNIKAVDLEGAMAYFNDSIIRPFNFPEDFLEDEEYITAAESGNVVEFFLKWLIDQHNAYVMDFQQFKLGNVTVDDPNNYITRLNSEHASTWDTVKSKLFDSSLGGYLCIRYEEDGNYIDYLEDFEETNEQEIVYGENLLDLSSESDASETYSAILPLGKRKNEIDSTSTDNSRLTIEDLDDAYITDDIVKLGDMIASISAIENYGIIFAPTSETTWDDVTDPENLRIKGVEYLVRTAMKLANTITIKAVDLHFSDEQIETFRIYRYINVKSSPHGQDGSHRLTQLDIDLQNPQNTVITLGDTQLSMTDINAGTKNKVNQSVETVKTDIETQLNKQLSDQEKAILEDCETLYNTKIATLAKNASILSSGKLGETIKITMTIGGVPHSCEIDLSKVRQAFADDATNVSISNGVVTFGNGTLVINGTKFTMASDGTVTINGGTVGGWSVESGKISAGDGTNVKTACVQTPDNDIVFSAGGTSDDYSASPYRVTKDGDLHSDVAEVDTLKLLGTDGKYYVLIPNSDGTLSCSEA